MYSVSFVNALEDSISNSFYSVGPQPSPSSSVSDSSFSTTAASSAGSASEITPTSTPSSTDASTTGSSTTDTTATPSSTDSSTTASSTTDTTAIPSSTESSTTASSTTDTTSAPTSSDTSTTASTTDTTAPAKRALATHTPLRTLKPRQSSNQTGDSFDYVNNSDEQAPADSQAFQSLSDAALAEANTYEKNKTLAGSEGPNARYIAITDLSNTYQLQADTDGNLYLGDIGNPSAFAEDQGFVVGDDAEQYFHYYPDVMAAYNVSRIRLSSTNAIPKDADFVALAPVDYDDNAATPSVYAGIDTMGGIFFTLMCNFADQASKIFLAADPVEGVKMLKEEKLRWTVTGGVVQDCFYLPWAVPASLPSKI